jgi:hypothetical protein
MEVNGVLGLSLSVAKLGWLSHSFAAPNLNMKQLNYAFEI